MSCKILIAIAIFGCMYLLGCGGNSSSNPLTPIASPRIVSISPLSGGPGTAVTIQGSGFGNLQGNSTVSFGGITVQPTSWSENVIVVLIPSGVTSNGTFVVTVGGFYSNPSPLFTITGPTLVGVSPISGSPGTLVTLTGSGFGATQGASYVAFNSQHAVVQSWSDTLITCLVPNPVNFQSGAVSIVVWVDGTRPSNPQTFNVTNLVIKQIQPPSDNLGASITIFGEGFGSAGISGNSVTIGGQYATIESWSETAIRVRLPDSGLSAGQVTVTVTVNNRSASYSFWVAEPTISGLSPSKVKEGEYVTIDGQNFGNVGEAYVRIYMRERESPYAQFTIVPSIREDNRLVFQCPTGAGSTSIFGTDRYYYVTVSVGGITSSSQTSWILTVD